MSEGQGEVALPRADDKGVVVIGHIYSTDCFRKGFKEIGK